MARKYQELRDRMPAEHRDAAARRAQEILEEMRLRELRRAMRRSQKDIATTLKMSQPGVSKLEQRVDLFVSTLRNYIRAMGGELEIIARFPEGAVRINQFDDIRSKKTRKKKKSA
jgi:transcriptional regulator with XRE-family HTH domain